MPTLMGAMIEAEDRTGDVSAPNHIADMTEEELDRTLRRLFRLGLDGISGGRRAVDPVDKGNTTRDRFRELEDLLQRNREAFAQHYWQGIPRLVVFYHDDRAGGIHLRILRRHSRSCGAIWISLRPGYPKIRMDQWMSCQAAEFRKAKPTGPEPLNVRRCA